jgi:predicted DNA-binding transcriptional regulator AlpA
MTMSTDNRKKLRAAQAAKYLEISPSTLAKWRMASRGPEYHRCGPRIVYYYQDEIDAWQVECDRKEREKRANAQAASS